jgi:hypothetical protein
LPHLVAMLLNLRKGSIGDEFARFFEVLHDQPLADGVTVPTKNLVQIDSVDFSWSWAIAFPG